MEFYSPQPEHVQLNTGGTSYNPKTNASHLLGLLHQQVLNVTKESRSTSARADADDEVPMGIDSVLEENAILSPPLSPEMSSVEDEEDEEYILDTLRLDDSANGGKAPGIVVKPSWRPGLSSSIYRHSTHGFLSEYRIFQNLTNNPSRQSANLPSQARSLRRSRVYKPFGSDMERVGRTRRVARTFSDDENTETELDFKRPSTPRRPKKLAVHSHHHQLASPLASANAVTGVSQYVPNMSWEKLPDYSPSVATLPANNVKCLKVEWKGSPMDLSNDPLKSKLHPAELLLAQVLRLPCDLYLDSKRRLFLEKTHRLKQGLPFRRTDAQKACRIDVNKASRLYAAFEKVGWLNDVNFTKHL